jgi:predicted CoA-binding protein
MADRVLMAIYSLQLIAYSLSLIANALKYELARQHPHNERPDLKAADVTEILGEPVYRDLREVPGEIDMVNVFRRDVDIPQHVDEIIAARPKSVWIQLGIRNDAAAEEFAKAGIKVVQNLCLMVEHRALV